MNFTPFGTTFAAGSLPAGHQFTTAKFAQQLGTTSGGQVVGLLSADEQGVTYLRPVDTNGTAFTVSLPQASGNNAQHNQIIALPINVPSKPGEMSQPQTVQIQVVNPANNTTNTGEKYSLPVTLQHFTQQGQTLDNILLGVIDPNSISTSGGGIKFISLAYNPTQTQPEGHSLHLQLQQTDENGEVHQEQEQVQQQSHLQHHQQQNNNNNNTSSSSSQTTQGMHCDEMVLPDVKPMMGDADNQAYPVAVVAQIPQELMVRQEDLEVDKDGQSKDKDKEEVEEGKVITVDCAGETYTAWQPGSAVADYFNRLGGQHPLNIHHFLKFSAETIKREQAIESSPLSTPAESEETTVDLQQTTQEEQVDDPNNPEEKTKKKKKYKKKAPKPRRPRPGQVHIATALDGTTLFCCPECNMAYPDKELLEQHLVAHKIERRFICDICGAGLKRKEHLERHKLGHNPERPYICSVCCKGFKRKEHLNLHFVIHSGEKTEVCPECGKGFYRKDHLRKHARSHLAKRVKEELQQASGAVIQTGPDDESTNTVVLPSAAETHPVALVQHHQH